MFNSQESIFKTLKILSISKVIKREEFVIYINLHTISTSVDSGIIILKLYN